MIKVAIVSTIQPETHYTRYLYRELKKRVDEIYLLVDKTDKNYQYREDQNDDRIIPLWKVNVFFPLDIYQFARKYKINVIHFQHEFNMYGGVKGIPMFILALLLCRLAGKQVVVTVHGLPDYKKINNEFLEVFALTRFKPVRPLVQVVFYLFYRFLGLLSDYIIVHSKYTQRVFIKRYGVSDNKCFSIPIGIEKVKESKEIIVNDSVWLNKIEGKRIILFFGYLLKRKGLDLLIEAYAEALNDLPGSVLVLAGGVLDNQKEYADELKVLVKKMGVTDEVVFTGFVSENELHYLYKNCEFVVLPYTYSISSSLPLSLAFSFAKPIVASDVGTLRDEIANGVNGLFFSNWSKPELKSRMVQLYTDEKLLKTLGEGALKERGLRSWDNVALATIEKTYREVRE